jgi:CPA1 family monovalent cation:H+ antiporter
VLGSSGSNVGLLIALLVLAIPVVALAKRANLSYPIVLVVTGLVLGFIPGLPSVQLDPQLVLVLFLPPLLYWEAITAPTDIMLENAGQIGVLAVGLVIATTACVAVVVHALVPDTSWAVAFVLGAIVSPTDELAAVPVLEAFRLPRHVVAIVEGESLTNDATALVLYAVALGIAVTGVFTPGRLPLTFAVTVAGSVALGLIAGRVGVELWRRIKDRQLQGVISVSLPFLAYLPAMHFGLSGVLAVVTAGVYANRFTPRVMTAAARTQMIGFWNTIVFIANALLFLVVGFQLHDVATHAFAHESWAVVVGYALAVNAVVIGVRIALGLLAEYAPTAAPPDHAAPNWKNALVVAWSGLRGSVSLAAALAIPLALPGGAPFPHRDLIIFVTFSVILVTLVGGGLTLAPLVRALHIESDREELQELRDASIRSYDAALGRIDELARDGRIEEHHAASLRARYEHLRGIKTAANAESREHLQRENDVEQEIIAAQRDALIESRERGEIDNAVLRRLLADLDLRASRAGLAEP